MHKNPQICLILRQNHLKILFFLKILPSKPEKRPFLRSLPHYTACGSSVNPKNTRFFSKNRKKVYIIMEVTTPIKHIKLY